MDERKLSQVFDWSRPKSFVDAFFEFNIDDYTKMLEKTSEEVWQQLGARKALKTFHTAAERVPAYADFLLKHGIDSKKIKTIDDFRDFVPVMDKKNYIDSYTLEKRSWDGKLSKYSRLIAVSSGTTGEPKFWPRGAYQEFEAAIIHEVIYKTIFYIHKYKTLLVIGFPMGVYVSGIATVLPSWLVGQKGYNLTVIAVGTNKVEMIRVVKNLGKYYQQIILVGHPFFLKDVVETGLAEKIKWREFRIKMLFCSEGFSESWRDYILNLLGETGAVRKLRAISMYGSSEMLLMACETQATIALRKFMDENQSFSKAVVGTTAVPNLFQFNPFFKYIESVNNELLFTSASGIPLIRFNLHDTGQVMSLSKTRVLLGRWGRKLPTRHLWNLPLVALWGRSDQTIVFYAANIYPEHIHQSLNHPSFLKKITGKFAIRRGYKKNMDEYLEINIELKPKVLKQKKLSKKIQHIIVGHLEKINMEYLFLRKHLQKDLVPKIKLWPYQHQRYFKLGLKPKYIVE